jgi:F0F1-type ATP synthase epsilon subunit
VSDLFNFSVVTPEQTYLDGEASMVVVPGIEGDIGFLANQAQLL